MHFETIMLFYILLHNFIGDFSIRLTCFRSFCNSL